MTMEHISIHDNQLLSYSVFCDLQEIRFHSVFTDTEPNEYTDVIFSGVVIYHFEGDNFNTIFLILKRQALKIFVLNTKVSSLN